jgi:iron complex outermembrane receptor protein
VERDSHYTSPSTRVTRTQIELQNAQTTEEVLKYQPSLQIRQRYVGDPNGVLGIRGADMFSTARNMVYADGLPLHNFLQASFNGAPRWSMVGPNEIDAVDVVYGPFSAEYSGNSIGGVINIKTRISTGRIRGHSLATGNSCPMVIALRTCCRYIWHTIASKRRAIP